MLTTHTHTGERNSLLGGHLSHVDPDADDLAGLHPHVAGTRTAAAGSDPRRGVEGRGGGVLGAGPPRPRLPVVNRAGVFVTVTHLQEGAAVRAHGAT